MPVIACPPSSPIVHGVVTFDPAAFRVLYPEFTTATASDAALAYNFLLATLILNNSCASIVNDANVRETLLGVLTAHLTALANGVNGQPAQGIVGRVDSATEGAVSVSAQFAATMAASYFLQTKYGALFWQLTAQYRTMRYVPAPMCYGNGSPRGFFPRGF